MILSDDIFLKLINYTLLRGLNLHNILYDDDGEEEDEEDIM